MGRRRAHAPLNILINGRQVGRLEKEADGAVFFQYDRTWVDWARAFPISLSLPLQPVAFRGTAVNAVFDNLLPDSPAVRKQVAQRTGARGADTYSLLEEIGRDCIGAMQFLPDGLEIDVSGAIEAEDISDAEIENLLANLARAPLGVDPDEGFRISPTGPDARGSPSRGESPSSVPEGWCAAGRTEPSRRPYPTREGARGRCQRGNRRTGAHHL